MQWKLSGKQNVYLEIAERYREYIRIGVLPAGEKLPSVRELSVLLDANPNTVQKAFAELDRAGLIVSYPGRGCFVSPGAREAIRERGQAKLSEITAIAADLLRAGFSPDELHDAIDRACRAPHAPQERKEAL